MNSGVWTCVVIQQHGVVGQQTSAFCLNCRLQLCSEHFTVTGTVYCSTFFLATKRDIVISRSSVRQNELMSTLSFGVTRGRGRASGSFVISEICAAFLEPPHTSLFVTKQFLHTVHKVLHKCRHQTRPRAAGTNH